MKTFLFILITTFTTSHFAQKKFAQLDMELPTPNEYRNAAGAPGHAYYQQHQQSTRFAALASADVTMCS